MWPELLTIKRMAAVRFPPSGTPITVTERQMHKAQQKRLFSQSVEKDTTGIVSPRGLEVHEGGLPLKNPIPACFPAEKGGQNQMSCMPFSIARPVMQYDNKATSTSCPSCTSWWIPLFRRRYVSCSPSSLRALAPLCEAHSAPSRLSPVHSLFHARHWSPPG